MRAILLPACLLAFGLLQAQSPDFFSYQGVARDAAGDPLASQVVGIQFRIHQNTPTGSIVFTETHAPTTDARGLFALQVGNGTPVFQTIADIDWSAGPYFLEVRMDPAGGSSYTTLGTQQLMSVPYALHAETVGTADTDWTETPTDVYTLKNAGVGIATPERRLDVGGNGTQYARVRSTTGGTTGLELMRQGTGTDWRINNAGNYLDIISSSDDFGNNTIHATFDNFGRLGVGTIGPQEELHVVGTIRNSELAGNGTRPVLATSSGDLVPGTAVGTQTWSANGYAFSSQNSTFNGGSIAWCSSGTGFIRTPVNLPQGATVTSVQVSYGDVTLAADIQCRLIKMDIPGNFTAVVMADLISVASPGATASMTDNSIVSPVIDNTTGAYIFDAQPYSGASWTSSINVRSVRINYTLP